MDPPNGGGPCGTAVVGSIFVIREVVARGGVLSGPSRKQALGSAQTCEGFGRHAEACFARRRVLAEPSACVLGMTVTAVLLAGGKGSRMGGGPEKPLRLLAGRPLLSHVIARVVPQVEAMVLNANGDPARFAGFGLAMVPDGIPDQPGPLAGILSGMRWAAARGATDVLSVPTDTPFLPHDLLARLAAARLAAGVPIACAESGGAVHPVVGLWPVDLADRLEADILAGQRRVRAWAAMFGVASAVFEAGAPDPFFNINHQEDLVEAERILLK